MSSNRQEDRAPKPPVTREDPRIGEETKESTKPVTEPTTMSPKGGGYSSPSDDATKNSSPSKEASASGVYSGPSANSSNKNEPPPVPPEPPFGQTPPDNSSERIKKEITEIEIDPEMTYVFLFGIGESGKSAILSSLMYYLHTKRPGDAIKNLNQNHIAHERRGNILLNDMLTRIPKGEFPARTATMASARSIIPRHIKADFIPGNGNKQNFKFCLLDVSGEELERVYQRNDDQYTELPEGIDAFLSLDPRNLIFISVYPSESNNFDDARLSAVQKSFMDLLDQRGLSDVPMLTLVSKWDLVKQNFSSSEEFIRQRAPIVWNLIQQHGRIMSYSTFSVGEVDRQRQSFVYDPEDAEHLFKWMYKTQMGEPLEDQLLLPNHPPSKWKKFINIVSGRNE